MGKMEYYGLEAATGSHSSPRNCLSAILGCEVQNDFKSPVWCRAKNCECNVSAISMARWRINDDLAGQPSRTFWKKDPATVTVNCNLKMEAEGACLLVKHLANNH
mmetsp:Transcript_9134/g.21700  ORF Transcript_9134/g.21700 Transcript_9134/m.21700 type:complete len:105 (-) Transcript_9134:3328-3642(-)